jgi:ribose 5-phosphate isomerase B
MKIVIACDHRGYEAKRQLLPHLQRLGHEVKDYGCYDSTGVDYPDFAVPASCAVGTGEFEVGILLDGSGIGMTIVANKIRGVRAAAVHDEVTSRRAREHHHCNVVCIGSDLLGADQVKSIVEMFLNTPLGDGRHARRVEKLDALDADHRPA